MIMWDQCQIMMGHTSVVCPANCKSGSRQDRTWHGEAISLMDCRLSTHLFSATGITDGTAKEDVGAR